MGRAPADVSWADGSPKFAALGHQESWRQISAIVGGLRTPRAPLSETQLREVVPWIPPRTVSRFRVAPPGGRPALCGIYVDTFITPDELAARPTQRILQKVRDGIEAARREGVGIVTLGGFTSILGESMILDRAAAPVLTTGNTLTAALIVRGVERAVALLGRRLEDETVLVIGATGDVGSACARWLSGRVCRLLLGARNEERLQREAQSLGRTGPVEASADIRYLARKATLVIAAASASSPCFDVEMCDPDAIVCDAGYPKNFRTYGGTRPRVFWGGMGRLESGVSSDGLLEKFYRFPVRDTAHGCMLEGAVLAMAGRFEPFSAGRGRIGPDRVDEIWQIAQAQGVSVAPLFDAAGAWPEEKAA